MTTEEKIKVIEQAKDKMSDALDRLYEAGMLLEFADPATRSENRFFKIRIDIQAIMETFDHKIKQIRINNA